MIYVSLSLRYQRQLNLIAPDVLESFFKETAAAAGASGGSILPQYSSSVYAFDSKDLCCAFSVFLTLEAILNLAEERKDRIKEYFIFVDSSENEFSFDEIVDRMSSCDNLIFPDRAAVLTAETASLLSPYANFEPVEGSSLFCYSGRKPESAGGLSSAALLENPVLIPFSGIEDTGHTGFLSALLNTASAIAMDFDAATFLTKKEAVTFSENKKAVKTFSASRFSRQHPSYIMEACEDFLKLFFTALSRFYAETKGNETVEIEIPQGAFLEEGTAHFEALLSEICVFKVKGEAFSESEPVLQAGVIDGGAVPPDIMDAAYLFFRASTFLYAGETDSLLNFLGKGRSFREAVGSWLSAAGFPHGNAFFRCMQNLAESGFPHESNKKRIDKYLFDYLQNKYKTGNIRPNRDFYERLSGLGIKIPDSLIVAAVYLSPNPAKAAEELKDRFSDKNTATAIAEHTEAEKKLSRGDFRAAQTSAKRALQVFQRAKIICGEFEAFSFLARLSFSRTDSSSGDAFSYLDYALENSVKMRDSAMQMRTLFDFASMHFLAGNFFQAQTDAMQLREKAAACYDKCWTFVSRFIEGRILFALGDYRASEKAFAALDSACPELGIEKASPLCAAWAFRSKVYQTKKAPIPEYRADLYDAAPEAALFALEGIARTAIERATPREAETLLQSIPKEIENIPPEGIYASPAEWSWKSSFALAEDRYLRGAHSSTASVFHSAFYAFCSAFYGKDAGDFASARDSIAALIKNNLPSGSPCAYILYYLCCELEDRVSGKNSPESLSFLSRAFKGVQLLANNIADSAMREKFLTEPYWNALLYSAAHENKLI